MQQCYVLLQLVCCGNIVDDLESPLKPLFTTTGDHLQYVVGTEHETESSGVKMCGGSRDSAKRKRYFCCVLINRLC